MKKLIALLALFVSPFAFAANPGLGAHAISAYIGGVTCNGCVSATTAASGSSFIVFVQIGGADTLTVSDTYNASTKWSHLVLGSGTNPIEETNDGEYLNAYVCANCSGGTADAVTVTGASSNLRYVELIEITNTTTVDASASAYNGNASSTVSVSVTPTVANDAIVASAINCVGSALVLTPQAGGNWTSIQTTTTTCNMGSGVLTGAASSAQDALMGIASGVKALAGITIAFKPSGGGATCTHTGISKLTGGPVVPTAGSTLVWLKSGQFGTVDCATTEYWQTAVENFGVN